MGGGVRTRLRWLDRGGAVRILALAASIWLGAAGPAAAQDPESPTCL